MLSWSSKGGVRLLSAAALAILSVFWSFTYLDLSVDTETLRRPWSSSDPEPVDQEQEPEHSEEAYVNHIPNPPLINVEDPFLKQYQSTLPTSSQAADQTEIPLQTPSVTALQTGEALTAPFKVPSSTVLRTLDLQALATSSRTIPTLQAGVSTAPSSVWSSDASSSDQESASNTQPSDIPLILYAYYETPDTRPNLQFFVSHALHANAKFVFILNGETDAEVLLPANEPNIYFIKRNNTCFDLGAYAEVLKSNNSAFIKQHKRFIMINASIRGPFVPFWSRDCWSDAYLGKLSDEVKLVGMTMNCRPDLPRHVQSMILATDSIGLGTLLTPDGIDNCPQDMNQAVWFETRLTSLVKAKGYTVSVMMAMGNSYEGWVDACANGDVTVTGAYDGANIHPYETMFVKTKRGADPMTLELLTRWHDGSNYSSYDYC